MHGTNLLAPATDPCFRKKLRGRPTCVFKPAWALSSATSCPHRLPPCKLGASPSPRPALAAAHPTGALSRGSRPAHPSWVRLASTAHLVKEGKLLQSAVLPHGSDGQVFGTSEFHFLLWREILCCDFVRVTASPTLSSPDSSCHEGLDGVCPGPLWRKSQDHPPRPPRPSEGQQSQLLHPRSGL